MNFRQLQTFLSVAKFRNFAKASEALFIAQSAVSVAIRKLEEDLDVKLFNRTNKKVLLTAEGEVLVRHANKILSQVSDARLELSEMKSLEKGEVKLAIPTVLASYYFPSYLALFKKNYPGLKVTIIDEGTNRIRDLLVHDRIDMGIVNMDSMPDVLEAHEIISEEVLVFVSQTHRLAKQKSILAKNLAHQDLILYREGYFIREIVDCLCEENKIQPHISFETNLVQLMKKLVLEEVGVGISLSSVLKENEQICGISFKPKLKLNFGIAWNKGSYLSNANRAFVDFILSNQG